MYILCRTFDGIFIYLHISVQGTGCFSKYVYPGLRTKLDMSLDSVQSVYLRNAPTLVTYDADITSFYTLIATDPLYAYLHWYVYNIPGNDVSQGQVRRRSRSTVRTYDC